MGLDVYLCKYEDYERDKAREKEYEEYSSAQWNDVGYSPSDEACAVRRANCDEKARQLGLRVGGSACEHIEIASAKYPEHLFKIGYWRSSYNDSGINRVLSANGLGDLNAIAGNAMDEYEFQPDWTRTKAKALEAIAALRQKIESGDALRAHCFSVESLFAKDHPKVRGEEGALKMFREQRDRDKRPASYSSIEGTFFFGGKDWDGDDVPEGFTCLAMIPGRDALGQLCMYAVCRHTSLQSYVESLEIVAETCDYVLSQPNPEKFWLHWSG